MLIRFVQHMHTVGLYRHTYAGGGHWRPTSCSVHQLRQGPIGLLLTWCGHAEAVMWAVHPHKPVPMGTITWLFITVLKGPKLWRCMIASWSPGLIGSLHTPPPPPTSVKSNWDSERKAVHHPSTNIMWLTIAAQHTAAVKGKGRPLVLRLG